MSNDEFAPGPPVAPSTGYAVDPAWSHAPAERPSFVAPQPEPEPSSWLPDHVDDGARPRTAEEVAREPDGRILSNHEVRMKTAGPVGRFFASAGKVLGTIGIYAWALTYGRVGQAIIGTLALVLVFMPRMKWWERIGFAVLAIVAWTLFTLLMLAS